MAAPVAPTAAPMTVALDVFRSLFGAATSEGESGLDDVPVPDGAVVWVLLAVVFCCEPVDATVSDPEDVGCPPVEKLTERLVPVVPVSVDVPGVAGGRALVAAC